MVGARARESSREIYKRAGAYQAREAVTLRCALMKAYFIRSLAHGRAPPSPLKSTRPTYRIPRSTPLAPRLLLPTRGRHATGTARDTYDSKENHPHSIDHCDRIRLPLSLPVKSAKLKSWTHTLASPLRHTLHSPPRHRRCLSRPRRPRRCRRASPCGRAPP